MARVTFIDPIKTLWGAIDSIKEGKQNGYRIVVRRHDYGENKNFDDKGHKWHELYYYHFHQGAWSDAATRNREMIKAAQRTAHDIERDPQLRAEWETNYAAYRASKAYLQQPYRFFPFVYVTIYRQMRNETIERTK